MSIFGESQSSSVNQLLTAPVITLEGVFHAEHTKESQSLSPVQTLLKSGWVAVQMLFDFILQPVTTCHITHKKMVLLLIVFKIYVVRIN